MSTLVRRSFYGMLAETSLQRIDATAFLHLRLWLVKTFRDGEPARRSLSARPEAVLAAYAAERGFLSYARPNYRCVFRPKSISVWSPQEARRMCYSYFIRASRS
jgi:hypothetical protein